MDANATTPVLPEVLAAMQPYFAEQFGNASSIHQHGQHARAAMERARESVAALLNCRAAEIVFTSGGTEGDNLALYGVAQPGDHIITSAIEHHAVLNAAEALARRGVDVTFIEVDYTGRVDPYAVRRAITPKTRLISIMMANNETGVLQHVNNIGVIAAEAGVLFHTDAVQAAGKVPIDVEKIGCHLLTISGHKMHAPQGVGALYVRRGTLIEPLFRGGNHERQRRAGTENVPGIVGLGKAAELARAGFTDGSIARLAAMRDRLEQGILSSIDETVVNGGWGPDPIEYSRARSSSASSRGTASQSDPKRASENGSAPSLKDDSTSGIPPANGEIDAMWVGKGGPPYKPERIPRVPNTTNIQISHIEGEALVIALDLKGLAVSTGAACSSGATDPSHVLAAMGLTPAEARASIRFSLGKHNTNADVDFALSILPETVARLRELSPVYNK